MDLGKPKPAVLLSPPSPAETAVGAERSIHHRTPCHHRIRDQRTVLLSEHEVTVVLSTCHVHVLSL
uniref:Uncharacterized protein n=1 Tax=Oryza glumipatula TaxID=40148 RepID=A0A0D9ZLI6_9ORYZ